MISIIYFTFICIHNYRLLIKRFPLSSRSGGFFGVGWRVRRFSRQDHTCINYCPPLVYNTASQFQSARPRSHPKLLPQYLLIISISVSTHNLLSPLSRDSSLQYASNLMDHIILPDFFCMILLLYLMFQQACFLISRSITRFDYLQFSKVSGCLGAKGSLYF